MASDRWKKKKERDPWPVLKPSYKRWKKRLDQILNWEKFDPRNYLTDAQITEWIEERRHRVMYRDESQVD